MPEIKYPLHITADPVNGDLRAVSVDGWVVLTYMRDGDYAAFVDIVEAANKAEAARKGRDWW